jgi:quercetin dioxygenase-like cupin family protein
MLFNLLEAVRDLHQNGHGASGVKRTTLHRNDGAIYVLLALEEQSHMQEHQAKAWASVQCLEGEVLFTLEKEEHLLHPGDVILMEPGQRHSLSSKISSAVLVTLVQSANND